MILKASQRRGANDLALHLSNEVDNEKIEIADMRGCIAGNLYDGFREWELICDQTQAKNAFYSLSINPDPNQRDWTDDEWQRVIEHIEENLGLSGQPRAIIYHWKEGEDGKVRKHCHVVWSRIKYENGTFKAIHLGNDHYKLKSIARDLAKEFSLDLPDGMTNAKNKKNDNYDFAKSHGQGRDVQSVEERKELITKLWHETEDAKTFCAAMSHAGYVVTVGDRRAFVVVDRQGSVHALARQIAGVNTREVKARLLSVDNNSLTDAYPTVEQAMDEQHIHRHEGSSLKEISKQQKQEKRIDLTKEQKLMQKLRGMARRADSINDLRQKKYRAECKEVSLRQEREIAELQRQQRGKEARVLREREKKKPEGMTKAIRVIFGYEMLLKWKQHQEDKKRQKLHAQQFELLTKRHKAEKHRLERKSNRLRMQEVREAQTLNRYCKRLGNPQAIKMIRQQTRKQQDQPQGKRLVYV